MVRGVPRDFLSAAQPHPAQAAMLPISAHAFSTGLGSGGMGAARFGSMGVTAFPASGSLMAAPAVIDAVLQLRAEFLVLPQAQHCPSLGC